MKLITILKRPAMNQENGGGNFVFIKPCIRGDLRCSSVGVAVVDVR